MILPFYISEYTGFEHVFILVALKTIFIPFLFNWQVKAWACSMCQSVSVGHGTIGTTPATTILPAD
jgi:hypothetical protein